MLAALLWLGGAAVASSTKLHGGGCTGYALKFEGSGNAIASHSADIGPLFGNATGFAVAWWQRRDGFNHGRRGASVPLTIFNPSFNDWFSAPGVDNLLRDRLFQLVAGSYFELYPDKAGIHQPGSAAPDMQLDYHDWHHLAVSFEAATGRIRNHLDGEVIADSIVADLVGWDIARFATSGLFGVLGVVPTSLDSHAAFSGFRGSLDRVYIWTEPLSDVEVRSHYTGDSASHRQAALAYEFDEGVGAPTAINSGTAGERFDLVLGRGMNGARAFTTMSGSVALYEVPRRVVSTIPDTRGASQLVGDWAAGYGCLGGAPLVQALSENSSHTTIVDLHVTHAESEGFALRVTELPSHGKLMRANGSLLDRGDTIDMEHAASTGATASNAIFFRVLVSDAEDLNEKSSALSNSTGDVSFTSFSFSVSNGSVIANGSVHLLPYVPPTADLQMTLCVWPMGVETCARANNEETVAEDMEINLVLFAGGGASDAGPQVRMKSVPGPLQGTLHQAGLCCDADARYNSSSIEPGNVLLQRGNELVFVPARDFSGEVSFEYTAVDSSGAESEAVTMHISVLPVDDLATVEPPPPLEFLEDSSVFIPLNASDPEGSRPTVFVSSLPKHGSLFLSKAGERGARVLRAHSDYAQYAYFEQFAIDVLNVSSYSALKQGDGHVLQILGERDVFAAGSSAHSWRPLYAGGESVGRSDGGYGAPLAVHDITRAMSSSWDHAAAYEANGYSEFVELKYDQPVYPVSVTIGENSGMGAVVAIRARRFSWPAGEYITLWSGEAQPDVQVDYTSRHQYRTFLPTICQLPTRVDVLRLELDTISVADYNEIDYVRLIGQSEPSDGMLEMEHTGVVYLPNANFNGNDTFEVIVSDCAGVQERFSLPETIFLSIKPVPDAPIASNARAMLLHAEDKLLALPVRNMDLEGQPHCVISRPPAAATVFLDAPNGEQANASATSANGTNASLTYCWARAVSARCGRDSFGFRAQMGKLLSTEANVSLFTVCLPPCDIRWDLVYTLSSCEWKSRKHTVLWAYNASARCSPERSDPLPPSKSVPCIRKLSVHTAYQLLEVLFGSIVCVMSILSIIYVLCRSSQKQFRKDVQCQLRLISLCGALLTGVNILLLLGEISELQCNWRPVWIAYTLMYAPFVAKLHTLWRIARNKTLKRISLDRLKTIIPIFIYAAAQMAVSMLAIVLYPIEIKMNPINLAVGYAYLFPTCNSGGALSTWLLLAQDLLVVFLCLYFMHGARASPSKEVRLEVLWSRGAILTLLLFSAIALPLPRIAGNDQAFILADTMNTVCDFSLGVSVCLAVVVPAWYNAKSVSGVQRDQRQFPESERSRVPDGVLTYHELEQQFEIVSAKVNEQSEEIMQQAQQIHSLTTNVNEKVQENNQQALAIEQLQEKVQMLQNAHAASCPSGLNPTLYV